MEQIVIFDMDGVLVDSEPLHFEMERRLFREVGIDLPIEEHEQYAGLTPKRMWTEIRQAYGLPQSVDKLTALEIGRKTEFLEDRTLEASPGIEQLILRLHEAGYRTSVASSSPHQLIRLFLNRAGLIDHFDYLVSGEDVVEGKPEPDIYLLAARKNDVPPERCLAIEDSQRGVRAAQAAGMRCIGYRNPNSGKQDLTAADYSVEDFSEESIKEILSFIRKG